jgi:hypothetical protein
VISVSGEYVPNLLLPSDPAERAAKRCPYLWVDHEGEDLGRSLQSLDVSEDEIVDASDYSLPERLLDHPTR